MLWFIRYIYWGIQMTKMCYSYILFALHPGFLWISCSKTLWISCSKSYKGVFCCVKEVTFGKSQVAEVWGLVTRRTNLVNRELELSVLPPGRGEELEIESWLSQWFNQSCLCNEASMKTKQDGLWRASRLVNGGDLGRVARSETAWRLHDPSYVSYSMHLFHLDVPLYSLSYLFIIN